VAFLNHRHKRLSEASALAETQGYRKRLGKLEFDYLAACRFAQRAAQRRTRRMQVLVGVLFGGIVAVAGLGYGGWLNPSYLKVRAATLADILWPTVLTASAERALKPGDIFKECSAECPEMVVVPAGEFMMGSPENEPGHNADESPQHKVAIAKPFAISKFEITFDEWDACVTLGGCAVQAGDKGWGRGTRPVINVSWDDAQQYVAWLSKQTGKPYRVLSEAEWEYAARAGSDKAYSWGNEVGAGNANCNSCGSQWDAKQTAPVGSFAANAFGLYDMHGNVWEWVEDCYHGNYTGAPTDGSPWVSRGCSGRVLRGGSWFSFPQVLRAAYRFRLSSEDRYNYFGFRLGRTLTP
jgi:formylglycine-generating enzyme required for sulfatase activity